MCGFAGEFVFGDGQADLRLARTMAETLAHRGPDEDGNFLSPDGRCAIGFRRLAVIDLRGSHQPMTDQAGLCTVAFNGEIYNFRQLRDQLSADGARFATAGDTEVLLALYARHGASMAERLDGMFAFAIYDARARRLVLVRDRIGQKPLWYARLADRIVFASQARALLAHPLVDTEVAADSITSYVSMGYIPAPASIRRGIRKLPPAHMLEVADGESRLERYWQPAPYPLPASPERQVELVRDTVQHSVEARMVSDVPLGALLSGGVDSSIVVALMSRSAGKAGGVKTFTAGFEDPAFDERPTAALVARHCGTEHTELLVRPAADDMLQSIAEMYDEPFADSSALPTYLICRSAREHVTVALAGDGGDEVFGGYDRYRALHLAETMGSLRYLAVRVAALVARPFAGQDERSRVRRMLRFAEALPHPYSWQYFMYRRLFGPKDLAWLFTDDFAASTDIEAPAEWFCDLYEQAELDCEVAHAQRHDLLTYLPDDLLVKTDIASMASSLELRAPMLDHRVVDLGLSLPVEMKLGRRRGKRILREAFGHLLPSEVFAQPKRGFAVPLGRWLREDLRETLQETLLDRSFLDRGVFRREAVAGLINDHLTGRRDHRHRLWALLVLARWWGMHG